MQVLVPAGVFHAVKNEDLSSPLKLLVSWGAPDPDPTRPIVRSALNTSSGAQSI